MSKHPMQDIIVETSRVYNDHVDQRTREIPDGTYLCVHEEVGNDPNDDWKVTYTVESHIIENLDVVCGYRSGLKSVFARKV